MEPSSDNTNRPVKTTSDAEDIVTGGKRNEGKPWMRSDEYVLIKAADEMKCDWARILTSKKYSYIFAGRTADELRDKYENMEKDKYEQMLQDAKKKQQMEESSRDGLMLVNNDKNKMLEALLARNELLRKTSEKMNIVVNYMQEEEKDE